MRGIAWQLWGTLALIGLVCLAWLGIAGTLLWAVLDPQAFDTILEALGGRLGLLIFLWGISLVPIYALLKWLMIRYIVAPERLADAVELQLQGLSDQPIDTDDHGVSTTRRLRALINGLLQDKRLANANTEEQVQKAIAQTEQERAWLSALLAELNRSVIVCNRQGRILLYNNRARLQFKRLSMSGETAGGGELLGLGRSIYSFMDRALIEHALEVIQRRLDKGLRQTSSQCLMQTQRGRTYRVHVTPVGRADAAMDGMILVIENITEEVQTKVAHQEAMHRIFETTRTSLSALSALAKQSKDPLVKAELNTQLRTIEGAFDDLPALNQNALRPFPLEDMSIEDCLEALQQQVNQEVALHWVIENDLSDVWIRVDGFSLIQALLFVVDSIHDQQPGQRIEIKVHANKDEVEVLFAWPCIDPPEKWARWPMHLTQKTAVSLGALAGSFNEIIKHLGAHWSFRASKEGPKLNQLRLALPRIVAEDRLPETMAQRHEGRPEYYDFRLFDVMLADDGLEQDIANRPLDELTYTVFDTETTGLHPSNGDAIIELGAIRIVHGRILNKETFEQLIDPQRPIPPSSTAIHGIKPEDVQGQPTIENVLPLFHAFCKDTVLVAHNADFDLQCLSMKAPSAGVSFDHPVLDTLLLSAIVHPFQDRHGLEQIAMRLGLEPVNRHRALGDARLTAQILNRLIPLLQAKNILTLHDAVRASQAIWQKRAKY